MGHRDEGGVWDGLGDVPGGVRGGVPGGVPGGVRDLGGASSSSVSLSPNISALVAGRRTSSGLNFCAHASQHAK